MTSLRLISGFLLFLMISVTIATDSTKAIIGIVELGTLFGTRAADGPPGVTPPTKPVPVPLRASPNRQSAKVGTIKKPENVVAREYDYEAPGALVYDRKNGWYLIAARLDNVTVQGWVAPKSAGTFHSLENLLIKGLAYVQKWDGRLYSAGDFSSKIRKFRTRKQQDIKVLSTRRTGDVLWLEVEVLDKGHCDETISTVLAKGWIPARRRNGTTQVWFYSRGC